MIARPAARKSRARRRRIEAGEAWMRAIRGASTFVSTGLILGRDVFSDAVSERPVLRQHLDKADEDILWTQAGILGQLLDDAAVQGLLLSRRSRVAHRELDHHQIIATLDTEIRLAVREI